MGTQQVNTRTGQQQSQHTKPTPPTQQRTATGKRQRASRQPEPPHHQRATTTPRNSGQHGARTGNTRNRRRLHSPATNINTNQERGKLRRRRGRQNLLKSRLRRTQRLLPLKGTGTKGTRSALPVPEMHTSTAAKEKPSDQKQEAVNK